MKDVYCHEHDFWYSDDDTCPVCEGIKLTTDRLEKLIEGYRGDEEMGWFIDQIDELLGLNLYSKEHLMTQEDETVSFIKAIEQLEYIAKAHHDSISRVRKLHAKVWRYRDCDCCPTTGDDYCCECDELYPCETIQALEGE